MRGIWYVLEGVPLALPQAHRWVVWPWRGVATKRSVQNGEAWGEVREPAHLKGRECIRRVVSGALAALMVFFLLHP